MKRRTVILDPEAIRDLKRLYDFIADATNEFVAEGYIDRIEAFCMGFDLAAERGHRRDDIRPGLRIAGFERRATIAFNVGATSITILRIFHGGQNWEDAFRPDEPGEFPSD